MFKIICDIDVESLDCSLRDHVTLSVGESRPDTMTLVISNVHPTSSNGPLVLKEFLLRILLAK